MCGSAITTMCLMWPCAGLIVGNVTVLMKISVFVIVRTYTFNYISSKICVRVKQLSSLCVGNRLLTFSEIYLHVCERAPKVLKVNVTGAAAGTPVVRVLYGRADVTGEQKSQPNPGAGIRCHYVRENSFKMSRSEEGRKEV